MNALSPLTYYRRHKGQAARLSGLVSIATAGLVLVAALAGAIFIQPTRSNGMLLSQFSVVMSGPEGLDPALMARLRSNPDVERVILAKSFQIALPDIMGGGTSWFPILALQEEDIPFFLERCNATLGEGQLVQPGTNGIMLSGQLAAVMGLDVGDVIQSSVDPMLYGNLVAPLEVVGILESDVRLIIASYEFVSRHEAYAGFPDAVLIAARAGRERAADEVLRAEAEIAGAPVSTSQTLAQQVAAEYRAIYSLLMPVATVIVAVITLVIGVANRIAFTRRLPEFGLLHAMGRDRRWLTRRLTMETAVLAAAGWVVGVGLVWVALSILKVTFFAPHGYDLDVFTWQPVVLALALPAAMVGGTLFTFNRVISRLDPVAVIEQGELNLKRRQRRAPTTSQIKPLASTTFYRRHAQQAVLLIGAMALMIMAVALVVIVLTASYDAQMASLTYLERLSRISALPGSPIDPGLVAQVQAHPAVARVIPIGPRYAMLSMLIPPFGQDADASPFAVYAEDMAYLVELYGLRLREGHLPRPHTNEMVIPEVLAQNRGLQVGDVIGDPDQPAYPGASPLPATFVISGIFARSERPDEENWLGFVSLEFMEDQEEFDLLGHVGTVYPMMVVPAAGQKATLDDWLERELAAQGARVVTYRREAAQARETMRSLLLTLALIESAVAAVATIGLTVLNTIFVSQRRSEFGLLSALGHGRPSLLLRVIRETTFTTGASWAISAILCLAGLLILQFAAFARLGLRLDPFNPTPWLFTLPIPLAVLAATAGTTAWMLSRFDPVSIIERR